MRGDIISKEFQRIEWVKDDNGKEFACYAEDVDRKGHVNEARKDRCMDLSLVLGDSW